MIDEGLSIMETPGSHLPASFRVPWASFRVRWRGMHLPRMGRVLLSGGGDVDGVAAGSFGGVEGAVGTV